MSSIIKTFHAEILTQINFREADGGHYCFMPGEIVPVRLVHVTTPKGEVFSRYETADQSEGIELEPSEFRAIDVDAA